jgi:hypothetical protein
MKLIYMESTLRLIAMSSSKEIQAIEVKGKMKQIDNVRYIVIEDGENG